MKLVFAFIFTVLCKPGTIYEYGDTVGSELPSTELQGSSNSEYYYFDLEYEDGVYLYSSNQRDSVWFYIEGKEVYYDDLGSKKNQEFEVQK